LIELNNLDVQINRRRIGALKIPEYYGKRKFNWIYSSIILK